MTYRHTQVGWASIVALAIGLMLMLAVFLSMTRLQIPPLAFVALIGLFGVFLLVFCSLTTEVDRGGRMSGKGRWPVQSFERPWSVLAIGGGQTMLRRPRSSRLSLRANQQEKTAFALRFECEVVLACNQ